MNLPSTSLGRARGFALNELLFTVSIISLVAAMGAGVYSGLRDTVSAEEQAQRMVDMAADVRRYLGKAQGSYTGLTPAMANGLGLIKPPMRWDGTAIRDRWGNVFDIYGTGPLIFSMTAGGATAPMRPSDCAAMATKLANAAWTVRVGATVTITKSGANDGTLAGGSAYKGGANLTQANLTAGCAEANTVVGAMFFER